MKKPKKKSNKLDVVFLHPESFGRTKAARALKKSLVQMLNACRDLKLISSGTTVVSISLVDDREMKKLNRAYRKKNALTDVLSFEQPIGDLSENPKGVRFLGDIVFCRSVVRTQARTYGHSVEIELKILLAHGLLHLLGMDHERSSRALKKMLGFERQVLLAAGVRQSPGLLDRAKL
ncbi:MAG TPA: rRNA maturation RNase YbeY [Oligoflexia bacterium]|nr:rRNA maturation RNase YbeY [Oligoflexia bacterium]